MSKYTTELRFICENLAGLDESKGYNDVNTIIEEARPLIFDFDYPIFDNTYKPILERKILKHFYVREIGEETYGLFKLRLDSKLNDIMPYYNKLYNSELIEFDPMKDTDVSTSGDKSRKTEETGSSTGTNVKTGSITDTGSGHSADGGSNTTDNAVKNDHWDYYSDTPQGTVQNLANLTYLTNARHVTDDGTGSSSTTEFGKTNDITSNNIKTFNNTTDTKNNTDSKTIDGIDEYAEKVTGKRWADSYSELLMKFRQTFLNIDLLIIDELEELFLQIW